MIDQTPFARMLTGPDADANIRAFYESTRYWLQSEQSSWLPHWSQLARFFMPRNQRFNYQDTDRGNRVDQDIVDNTGTMAIRIARAGMMSTMSNPAREWFKVKTDDEEANEDPEIQDYLEHGAEAVRNAMMRSNFYPALLNAYGDLILYGSQAFCIMEDDEDDIRTYPYPIGSYLLSGDDKLRVSMVMRTWQMTAQQMVAQYGIENVSPQVRTYYESNAGGQKEQWWPIVHVVHPNTYYGELAADYPPIVSVHYELSNFGRDDKGQLKLLRRGGFQEMPIIASRWEVTGENIYGNSPCMDALGDVMSLQLKERRKAEAIDKQVKPPMVASPAMMNGKMSILPGDITFGDPKDASLGFKPAFEMKFDISAANEDQSLVRQRINEALYKTLFLMISGSDRRDITAEEIRARQEEKMLVMGPVVERSNTELFKPAIRRIWAILRRRGKIKPPPASLRGHTPSFEFESIVAQAQRMLKIAAMDRFLANLGNQAAVNPSAVDILDSDEFNREYGEALGVPIHILRSADDMEKIRQQKAQQQQAAQQADMAQKLAPAAQQLSQADTSGDNALTRVLGAIGQNPG